MTKISETKADINAMIRVSARTGDEITPALIYQGYLQYNARLPEFNKLYEYYLGRHEVFKGKPMGAKIMSNIVRYGVDNITSYISGNEPNYQAEDNDAIAKQIMDEYEKQDMSFQETELMRDCQIFGRAYQLVYHADNAEGLPESVVLSPLNSFVAYDESTNPDSVYGAVVRTEEEIGVDGQTKQVVWYMDVYSPGIYQLWRSNDPPDESSWTKTLEEGRTRFTRVNLIEYMNNGDYLGAIQGVISLQDALNSTLSDRQDDKDAFAAAMLFVTGGHLGMTPEEAKERRGILKDLKVITGDPGDDAKFLIKQMDEAGVQTYTDFLVSSIHKLMRVPDFSDEKFSGNASGVALQYKLFGTEMIANITSRYFNKGYKRRCKLYDEALGNGQFDMSYGVKANVGKMSIVFNYSTIVDPLVEAQAIKAYQDAGVSWKTSMSICSIVPDIENEIKLLEEERAGEDARNERIFDQEFRRNQQTIQNNQQNPPNPLEHPQQNQDDNTG